jgi:hypothetical protein
MVVGLLKAILSPFVNQQRMKAKNCIIILGALSIMLLNSCMAHKHMCHNNRYNQRPHPPGKAANFAHDLSGYRR